MINNPRSYSLYDVIRYLTDSLNVDVTKTGLKQLLEEQKIHKGSIIAIKRVLSDLEIDSSIYRVDLKDILGLKGPFIAHIENNTEAQGFVVIKVLTEKKISYFDSVRGEITESVENFLKRWDGVILVPFTNEQSGEPDFSRNQKSENSKIYTRIAYLSLFIIGFSLLLFNKSSCDFERFSIWLVFFLCKITGLVLSIMIIKVELADSDSKIRAICKNSECEKVLRSSSSYIFSWLSMGDIGIIYFSWGILLLATDNSATFANLYILICLNFLALPYTLYSIYFQWKIAKTFCPFCCTVIFLLWLEFVSGIILGYNFSIMKSQTFILSIIDFIVVMLLWFPVKTILEKALMTDTTLTVISRIKKDVELFKSILNSKSAIPEICFRSDIILGDISSPFVLIVIISVNCHSCHQLFKELKIYSEQFPERLKIILRFKSIDLEISEYHRVIDWIFTKHLLGETSKSLELFENWNEMKANGVRNWEEKNFLNDYNIITEATQARILSNNWIDSLELPGVPAMILNGKLLPTYYSFYDIKYLIRHFYDEEFFR